VIGLRNADGHVSEIRASLPATLVLPPSISSTGTTPHLDDSTINHISCLDSGNVLPSYESRIYDRLWDGVSYGGLDTSTLNTPATMSQRASSENLRELNRASMPSPVDLEAGLRQALRERNDEEPQSDSSSRQNSSENLNVLPSTSGAATPLQSAPSMEAQNSQQSANITITTSLSDDDEHPHLSPTSSPEYQHISRTQSSDSISVLSLAPSNAFLDVHRLSRVPSYRTANSSNILNLNPIAHTLPTYSALETIPERPLSRSRPRPRPRSRSPSPSTSTSTSQAGLAESTSQSSSERFLQPPSVTCSTSSGDIDSSFQNVGPIESISVANI
jgi:arrestin-related trafficking adapter 4/5/7